MKKRIVSLLILIALCLTFIPAAASAADPAHLFARNLDWDNGFYLDQNSAGMTSVTMPRFNSACRVFFYGTETSSVMVPLNALSVTGTGAVSLREMEARELADASLVGYAVSVEGDALGTETIVYSGASDNNTFRVDIVVPDAGFYTGDTIGDCSGLLRGGFTVTDDSDSFYLLLDGWIINSIDQIVFQHGGELVTAEAVAGRSDAVKFTVNVNTDFNGSNVDVRVKNAVKGNMTRDLLVDVWLNDGRGSGVQPEHDQLMYKNGWVEDGVFHENQYPMTEFRMPPGHSMMVRFYYGTTSDPGQALEPTSITFAPDPDTDAGPDTVTARQVDGYWVITINTFGSGMLNVESGGTVYSMPVFETIPLDGFFRSYEVLTKENYIISGSSYTDGESVILREFYLVSDDDNRYINGTDINVTNGGEYVTAEPVQIGTVAENGNAAKYAIKICISDDAQGEIFVALSVGFTGRRGSEWVSFTNNFGLRLTDSRPPLLWKKGWVTEDGDFQEYDNLWNNLLWQNPGAIMLLRFYLGSISEPGDALEPNSVTFVPDPDTDTAPDAVTAQQMDGYWEIRCNSFGSGRLKIEADGAVYWMPASVVVPNNGFSRAPFLNEQTYILQGSPYTDEESIILGDFFYLIDESMPFYIDGTPVSVEGTEYVTAQAVQVGTVPENGDPPRYDIRLFISDEAEGDIFFTLSFGETYQFDGEWVSTTVHTGLSLIDLRTEPRDDTLVIAYPSFNGKFSPFFSETAYDQDVWAMTQVSLLTSDRRGAVITSGVNGQTVDYNGTDYTYYAPADLTVTRNADGTVDYDFVLRDDIVFSDGVPLTVDDVIFTMYALCDPTYDGSSTLYAQPIEGLAAYRAGMDQRGRVIFDAGQDGYVQNELYTQEQYGAFWQYYNEQAGVDFAQEIVDYCVNNYASYGPDYIGHTAAQIYADPEYQVQLGMVLWGFEDYWFEGATAADYWNAILEKYNGDIAQAENAESAGSTLLKFTIATDPAFQVGVQTGESAPSISGIMKTGEYSFRIRMTEFDATALYHLGITIAPLHYYGDASLYDYDNDSFGFPKGDLSSAREKTTMPMGAGPYKFVSYKNGKVTFEANENYYLGAPKIGRVIFKEAPYGTMVSGVVSGDYDISEPAFSVQTINEIKQLNSNGELTGDKITTVTVDNLGYGYIGINASRVNVGGDAASEASKDLRKAFATALSLFREEGVVAYYGDRASVINYPISSTSWAAPQTTDPGYEVAFSKDVNGDPIYTSGMTSEEKIAAAKAAVLGFLEAAGYTVEDGRVTAAPGGASLEYTVTVPGDGHGDHPSYSMAVSASALLAEIGMTMNVNDLTNSSDLWDGLDANTIDMWCAAWGAAVDPDMYQIYHSSNVPGLPGSTGSNHYYICDDELDSLIMAGRASADQAERKAVYKNCLDIIMDWGVEVPVYQRKNAFIFSSERIDTDTLPDITTFYGWFSEIQNIELRDGGTQPPVTTYALTLTDYTQGGQAPATVTGVVNGGEYAGETSFTVNCDKTCLVLASRDGGATYERLTATAAAGGYSFTVDVDCAVQIAIVLVGDVTLDGKVNTTDVTQIKRFIAGKREFDAVQSASANVNGDSKLNTTDVTQLKRYIAGKRTFEW